MGIPQIVADGYHGGMIDETAIRDRFEAMRVRLDERERRLFAAAEARSAGYGGVSAVARATGIARSTIDRGLKELAAPDRARLEGSPLRRWTACAHASRSDAVGRPAWPSGVDDTRRSDASADVGLQEPCEARVGAGGPGA